MWSDLMAGRRAVCPAGRRVWGGAVMRVGQRAVWRAERTDGGGAGGWAVWTDGRRVGPAAGQTAVRWAG